MNNYKKKENRRFKFIILFTCFICLIFTACYTPIAFARTSNSNIFSKYEFKQLSPFNTKREDYSAVELQNGNILITGGRSYNYDYKKRNTLSSTEIYDSKQNKIKISEEMNIPRYRHSSILLNDGNVLITGGDSRYYNHPSKRLKSAEIYDTKNNKFIKIQDMHYAMASHKMILLKDGNVLIINNPQEIELFNTQKYTFEIIKGIDFQNKKITFEVLKMSDNYLLLYPSKYIPNETSIILVDLNTLTFKTLDINIYDKTIWGYSISKINENEFIITGGHNYDKVFSDAKIINIKTNTIKDISNLSRWRFGHSSITLDDGNILIFGGTNDSDLKFGQEIEKLTKNTEMYITSNNKFIKFKDMKQAYIGDNYIRLKNGNYFIWGSGYQTPEILIVKNK